MIFHLFRRTRGDDIITSLYGTIVAQARAAAFYQNYGVPDTVNGRFEMIVLHVVVLLHRLAPVPGPICRLRSAELDRFFRDLGAKLGGLGVVVIAGPRKISGGGGTITGLRLDLESVYA